LAFGRVTIYQRERLRLSPTLFLRGDLLITNFLRAATR
jgi:hypothetical protein